MRALSEGGQVLRAVLDPCNVFTDAKVSVDGEQFRGKNQSGDVCIPFLRRAAHAVILRRNVVDFCVLTDLEREAYTLSSHIFRGARDAV